MIMRSNLVDEVHDWIVNTYIIHNTQYAIVTCLFTKEIPSCYDIIERDCRKRKEAPGLAVVNISADGRRDYPKQLPEEST